MTFNEQNVERDTVGRFSEKIGSTPELTLNRAGEIAYARESDTRIAEAWSSFHAVNDKALFLLRSASKRKKSIGHYRPDSRERILRRIEEEEAKAAEYIKEAAPLREKARELDRELYDGWNRFFLVEHIHGSQHCSSFRPTTRVGWLPNVSGLTEAEAVREHGATLCTICFPSAPTELTTKPMDESTCSGSGKYVPNEGRRYVKCADCGEVVNRLNSGKLRKHTRP